MKKGQIILGAAAFVITAISAFSFKVHSRMTQHRIYGLTDVNNLCSCTATTCFTNFGGGNAQNCHTVLNFFNRQTVFTVPGQGVTWYLGKTAAGNCCTDPYHGNWTHNS